MTTTPEIIKNGFYAYLQSLKDGIGFVILEEDEDLLKGLEFKIGGTNLVALTKDQFYILHDKNLIQLAERLPKFVRKELKQVYNSLLEESKQLQ